MLLRRGFSFAGAPMGRNLLSINKPPFRSPTNSPELEAEIRTALAQPDRPGICKLAKQFNVGTGTVQRIAHG
jgi:hypothetical protein